MRDITINVMGQLDPSKGDTLFARIHIPAAVATKMIDEPESFEYVIPVFREVDDGEETILYAIDVLDDAIELVNTDATHNIAEITVDSDGCVFVDRMYDDAEDLEPPTYISPL